MNCEQFRERISDYLDGAMNAQETQQMDEHMKACTACRTELEDTRRILSAMKAMGDEMPVPLPVQAAWRKAVRAEEKAASRGRLSFFSRGLATVAAALMVLFGATFITRQQGMLPQAGKTAATTLTMAAEEAEDMAVYGSYETAAASPRFFGATMTDGALKRETSADAAQPEAAGDGGEDTVSTQSTATGSAVRVLRSAQLGICTDSFDSDRMMLENIVLGNEGYFELTTETRDAARALVAVARIPSGRLDDFLAELAMVGETETRTLRSDDVSYRFTDLEGRIRLCDEKLAKLYELQEGCTDVTDLMTLSAGIEETLAQREKLQGRLNGLTAQEEYARVEIALYEQDAVYEFPAERTAAETVEPAAGPTAQPEAEETATEQSVGERIGEKFSDSTSWLKTFGEDALVLLVGSLPKLVVAVPALVLLILLIRYLVVRRKRK